jgi:hypothetical protein
VKPDSTVTKDKNVNIYRFDNLRPRDSPITVTEAKADKLGLTGHVAGLRRL